MGPSVPTLWSHQNEQRGCIFFSYRQSLSSEPVIYAAEELAIACTLHKWFGVSSDELEVESVIEERFVPPEINRRRNTPHQTSIFQTYIATTTVLLPSYFMRLHDRIMYHRCRETMHTSFAAGQYTIMSI